MLNRYIALIINIYTKYTQKSIVHANRLDEQVRQKKTQYIDVIHKHLYCKIVNNMVLIKDLLNKKKIKKLKQ